MNSINSDYNSKMEAAMKFDAILTTVQTSNLNFHVEMSPFSAVIHLKKSLIVNQLGVSQIPPPPDSWLLEQQKSLSSLLAQRLVILENMNNTIKSDYEIALRDCAEANSNNSKPRQDLESAIAETKKSVLLCIENYAM